MNNPIDLTLAILFSFILGELSCAAGSGLTPGTEPKPHGSIDLNAWRGLLSNLNYHKRIKAGSEKALTLKTTSVSYVELIRRLDKSTCGNMAANKIFLI